MTPDTLYSRSGRHLCEDAEAALDGLGWVYTRVEISGDAELERLYGLHVPVLVRAGRVLLRGVINRSRLQRLAAG
ncbi:glutaredoxin family protein [Deinococcus sp.]|uniref:glutaredoxin family protein n=1 Tax=Deinococcus sp. TaxID=47478 RepID=UPI003C7D5034